MWKYINKQKGVYLKQKNVDVYNEDGSNSIMEKSDVPERMMSEWRGI